jgi:hypothetical protein
MCERNRKIHFILEVLEETFRFLLVVIIFFSVTFPSCLSIAQTYPRLTVVSLYIGLSVIILEKREKVTFFNFLTDFFIGFGTLIMLWHIWMRFLPNYPTLLTLIGTVSFWLYTKARKYATKVA